MLLYPWVTWDCDGSMPLCSVLILWPVSATLMSECSSVLVPNLCCSTCCHGRLPLGFLSEGMISAVFWVKTTKMKSVDKCLV